MNEKSKAFELIEFVWNNEKTDSYLRVNIAMYEAVKLAIISQMKFNKEDFQNIFSKFSGGYWFGVNANGKGYGENFYRKAVTSGNISACQSYEAFCNIKPFIDSKGRRLCKGAMYRDNEKRYRVTGFDFSTKKVYLVGYAISDWEEKGKKTLFNFTNNEWNINTPSMNTEFEGDHPHEMIWVHSSGNMFSKFIYLEKSMVRQYLELAKKKIHSINPDYVLIDTPPSVTNVHIELLSRVKVSYVLFVTQPTKLSNQDVLRTMDFFHERCGKVNCGIVENMCYGTEHNEYPIRLVAQIPMQDNMNTENLLTNAYNEFQKIVDEIVQSDIVVLEEYSTENGYDENFDVTDIHITGSRKHYFTHELKYDNGVEKTLTLPAMKFLSVRTWDKVRDYIRFHDDMGHLWDERMRRCDTERVGRVVNHFQNDDNAYFMVINAPNTEVHLITGEIGICSLLTGQRGHFELPRVSYQTSKGNVVLFPDEIMPVDINLLQQEINEGYIMLSDGRYLPPKEAVQQCYNAFGIRVGLGDNWEDIYDGWNKEMK